MRYSCFFNFESYTSQRRPDQDRLGGEKVLVSLWRHFSDIVVAVPGTGAGLIVIAGVFGRIGRTATVFRDTGRALRDTERDNCKGDGGIPIGRIDGDIL